MSKIAVFASGKGSNFQQIHANIANHRIPAEISCLITDNFRAGAIEFAHKNAIAVYTVPPKDFVSAEEFGKQLLNILVTHQIDWVVLAGYLKKIPENVVSEYSNRILNIHPALLPAFGGKGMYGLRVHQAVLESGAKISGVTVHLVNNDYDKGPIVMQRAVDIEACSTAEEIAAAVLKVEHLLYPEAVRKILSLPFTIVGNRVIFS